MISLITMGSGNVLVLKKTLESFHKHCNEVIYGDMLLFDNDREIIKSYEKEFNLKIVKLPFNFIFKNGFSACLNELSRYASNSFVIYSNTSEVIDEDYGISDILKNNLECNSFYFTHRQESHRWFRCYNRHELEWSGRIHEQLKGEFQPYYKPIFMMKDLPKDLQNSYKAKIFDFGKEIVYFQNYMAMIDKPEEMGETDPGWLEFTKSNYDSFKERLEQRGNAYEAYKTGNFEMLMDYFDTTPDFMKLKFDSNIGIEYQTEPKKYLL